MTILLGPLDRAFLRRIVLDFRRKRQSLMNSHRQSRWITSDSGYSSIISAAVRLHDQCVAIGQASGGAAAVQLLNEGVLVREIPFNPALLQQLREGLCNPQGDGFSLTLWPFRDMPVDHPAYSAVNLLAVSRMIPMSGNDVEFQPDQPATVDWQQSVREATTLVKQQVPELNMMNTAQTRGKL